MLFRSKTLNGLLLERLETIPEAGATLRIEALEFDVLQIADNAIRTVRVRPHANSGTNSHHDGSDGSTGSEDAR